MTTTLLKNSVGQRPATEKTPPSPAAAVPSATAIQGETTIIEADGDLYHRVTTRLGNPAETVAAEDVLGPLDQVDDESAAHDADRE